MSDKLREYVRRAKLNFDEMVEYTLEENDRLTEQVKYEAMRKSDALRELSAERQRNCELSAADDWTPITSVEQVEGLTAGFYECERTERVFDNPYIMLKLNDEEYKFLYDDGLHVTETKNFAAYGGHSYKLIRAFETAAPSIPAGAFENTFDKRVDAADGYYIFTFEDGEEVWNFKSNKSWYTEVDDKVHRVLESALLPAKYFTRISLAALEALAKGER